MTFESIVVLDRLWGVTNHTAVAERCLDRLSACTYQHELTANANLFQAKLTWSESRDLPA